VLASDPVLVGIRPVPRNPRRTVSSNTTVDGVTLRTGRLQVDVRPAVTADQRVSVLLSGTGAGSAQGFTLPVAAGNGVVAPATSVTTVAAPFERVPAGRYVVRIEVDGAQSVPGTTGGVFATPSVTI
jgi:hypothetical protein